ncbi:MAG: hypothetical protein OFPI_31300 [Osedax symbiont Rs2]|nr:MAG: hypothetical protein OFPI_31300 [Osedax symbiont Rs2]
MQPVIEHIYSSGDLIGESPIWSSAEQALYWLDTEGHCVHRLVPESGDYQRFKTELALTAIAFCETGGWLSATKQGLYHWDRLFTEYLFLGDPVAKKPGVRFNDAVVDRQGRWWAGTLNEEQLEASDGELFCMTSASCIKPMAAGFSVANGISWSLDGSCLYISNMFQHKVEVFSQDINTGQLSNRRTFISFSEADGMPDGLTVDAQGYLWVALWGGGKVCRFNPQGDLEQSINLPVSNPTRCTFGGVDLTQLYVCSARFGLSDAQLKQQPMAGDLFKIDLGIQGLTEQVCSNLKL